MNQSASNLRSHKLFYSAFVATNFALPFLMSYGVGLITERQPRLVVFLLCVIVLFTLNQKNGQAFPVYRLLIWATQALNLITALLFGSVAIITAVPNIVTMVSFFLR